jgi:hypothetical protein
VKQLTSNREPMDYVPITFVLPQTLSGLVIHKADNRSGESHEKLGFTQPEEMGVFWGMQVTV